MHYLIWSNEHRAWWQAGGFGYTTATHRAGVYGFEEAEQIVIKATRHQKPTEMPNEVMVLAPMPVAVENDLTSDLQFPEAFRLGRIDAALAGQLSRSMQENARLKLRIAELMDDDERQALYRRMRSHD